MVATTRGIHHVWSPLLVKEKASKQLETPGDKSVQIRHDNNMNKLKWYMILVLGF
jgi:hypothetical protein